MAVRGTKKDDASPVKKGNDKDAPPDKKRRRLEDEGASYHLSLSV